MKEFEFTSQICTTKHQSEQLLEMGLKPETADMVYHFTGSIVEAMQWELQTKPPTLRGGFWTKERIEGLARSGESGEEVFDKLWGKDIPAWSLPRLMEIMPNEITFHKCPNIFALFHEDNMEWRASYCGTADTMKDSPYEACISMIGWLIKNEYLNKDYLK